MKTETLLKPRGLAEFVSTISFLPSKVFFFPAKVAVVCRGLENRLAEIESLDNPAWCEIEMIFHDFFYLDIRNFRRAFGLYHNRNGFGDADRIRKLQFTYVR